VTNKGWPCWQVAVTNKGWPRWQQLIRTASAQAALENKEILDLLFQLNPLGKFEEITFVHKHIPH